MLSTSPAFSRHSSSPTAFPLPLSLPSFPQNRNLGPTNTSRKAATHNAAMIPYSFKRPNQPWPSVILLSVPILRSAASIPSAFLSSPPSARANTLFSLSRLLAKLTLLCFRLCARATRDAESVSCSVRLWERRVSVWWREDEASFASCCDLEPEKSAEVVVAVSVETGGWKFGFRERKRASRSMVSGAVPGSGGGSSLSRPLDVDCAGANSRTVGAAVSSSSSSDESSSDESSWSSSISRLFRRLMSSRLACRSAFRLCRRDWTLIVDVSCSRRRRSVRAYSTFYAEVSLVS